jgi:hypothetical protein
VFIGGILVMNNTKPKGGAFMAQVTATELAGVAKILDFEAACYDKFAHYAQTASEKAVKMLCSQLQDRTREHYEAVLAQLSADSSLTH